MAGLPRGLAPHGRSSPGPVPPGESSLELVSKRGTKGFVADEGGGEGVEGCPDILPALIADREAAEASEPGQGSLDHPAMAAQALAAVDPAPGDARLDAACATGPAATGIVVSLVSVQLARRSARTASATPHGRDRVQRRHHPHAVVQIGWAENRPSGTPLRSVTRWRCCTIPPEAEAAPFPSGSGDAGDLALSEGREAAHQGDADVDLGGLAVGRSGGRALGP